ncbi:hypothetical protein L1887_52673 [Cichorium endivia]|nr:hypothetical protein L1887_52673 [Cichorium endivia]
MYTNSKETVMTNNPPSSRIQPGEYGFPPQAEASSGKRDIDLALDAAHKAKDKWGHTSVQDRAAILFKNRRPDGAESGAAGDGGNLG